MRILLMIALISFLGQVPMEAQSMTNKLYDSYEQFKEPTIKDRRFKHSDIQGLIDQLQGLPGYTVATVGHSIQGRTVRLISVGEGDVDVFLWSQMHGDEPTATMAIFDILNFLTSDQYQVEKRSMLQKVRLHFLPMLNPDGAELYQRRNALGIDINRDALRLQSPEGQILKKVRDSLDANFGFNLHDQSRYYNAFRTEKPATISYLAPAYNYEKSVNTVRANAMRVIVMMNRVIQKYAPGQVGSYNDAFEPRAFGDNLQKWGTSTILIESGGYPADREKQEIRKLNYVSLLSAIFSIADQSYKAAPLEEYKKIPGNDRKLFDLKLEKVTYPLLGNDYILDLGINRYEVHLAGNRDFYYRSGVADQGDLSTYYGYENINASGYTLVPGKIYPRTFPNVASVERADFKDLLKQGYTYVRVEQLPRQSKFSTYPVHLVGNDFELKENTPGQIPHTFFLQRDGRNDYAIINGFVYDLINGSNQVKNALIFR